MLILVKEVVSCRSHVLLTLFTYSQKNSFSRMQTVRASSSRTLESEEPKSAVTPLLSVGKSWKNPSLMSSAIT